MLKIPRSRDVSPPRSSSFAAVSTALAILLQNLGRAGAEDHLDYKYENYAEDNHRIEVENHSALLEADLLPWLAVRGNFVYDAISGQTPTGAPQNSANFLAHMRDTRRAEFVEGDFKWRNQTFSPQFSYSKESDYKSLGASLGYSIDLNQKNTTLNLGISRNFDEVIVTPAMPFAQNKDYGTTSNKLSSEFLIGVNQLLGPKTILTVNGSLGYDSGDLNDPYRGVYFQDFGATDPSTAASLIPEARPRNRTKEVGYISVIHFFTRLDGSLEGSYKFYHDSYGIFGQTVAVSWFQKIGKQIVLSPSFRYYTQTAASFYYPTIPANVADPGLTGTPLSTIHMYGGPYTLINQFAPNHFSADYRLAEFNSFTFGLGATWRFWKHGALDGSFERYVMQGTDGVTASALFPNANIFTVGLRFWL